jgi:hypothetical protein
VEDQIFLTYDSFVEEEEAVLGDVRRLEQDPSAVGQALPAALNERVRALIAKGARTGTILDSFKERRNFQKELDYLTKLLERFSVPPEDSTLASFRPESLASIVVGPFPFDDISDHQAKDPKPTSEVIQEYLLNKARAVELRFDDGLVEEISTQLAGDDEAWPLLWCCLWHLYAMLSEQRLGNKLRRSDSGSSFDCKSFLVQIAQRAYADFPAVEQPRLRAVLVDFDPRAGGTGKQSRSLTSRQIAARASKSAANVIDHLTRYHLLWRTGTGPNDHAYCLVHRSLFVRWGELRDWVGLKHERRRARFRLAAAFALVLAVYIVNWYRQERFADRTNALRRAEAESNVLAMNSLDILPLDNDLALETALEAVCKQETDLAWESLARVLDDRRETRRFNPPKEQR